MATGVNAASKTGAMTCLIGQQRCRRPAQSCRQARPQEIYAVGRCGWGHHCLPAHHIHARLGCSDPKLPIASWPPLSATHSSPEFRNQSRSDRRLGGYFLVTRLLVHSHLRCMLVTWTLTSMLWSALAGLLEALFCQHLWSVRAKSLKHIVTGPSMPAELYSLP